MKRIIGTTLVLSAMLMASCGNQQASNNDAVEKNSTNEIAMKEEASAEKSYPVALVNNKKDPSCGMPVTAGISDTLHYKEYVLGFCAEGCKDEAKQALLKNPKAVLDSAKATLPSGTTTK